MFCIKSEQEFYPGLNSSRVLFDISTVYLKREKIRIGNDKVACSHGFKNVSWTYIVNIQHVFVRKSKTFMHIHIHKNILASIYDHVGQYIYVTKE